MEHNILEIHNLTKTYPDFSLNNINLSIPHGMIVGLIGENGAGKSTLLKTILGLIQIDKGDITVLDEHNKFSKQLMEQIGVVFDNGDFPETYTAKKLNNVMKNMYIQWDEARYFSLLNQLDIPQNRKIKHLSKGMKMKLAIIVAFSHHSKLLILDEPTSGLDPIIRDDILDLFLDFVQDENHAILVSSHITSDLEKIADYIVFIHAGEIIFQKEKDELLYKYGIVKCTPEQFEKLNKDYIITYRKQAYEWQVLISDREYVENTYSDMVVCSATIDEIMMLYIRGESI